MALSRIARPMMTHPSGNFERRASQKNKKIPVANLTRIRVLYHQRMSSLFRTLVAGAMARGSQRDTEVTIGLCVCGLAEGDLVLHKSVNR
jgi:hypothetical protein